MSATVNPILAVYELLKEDAAVYALTNQNLYPNILPDGVSGTAIVYGETSQDFQLSCDGPVPNGQRFQLELYADSYEVARNLAIAVKNVLDWYVGTVNTEVGFTRIHLVDQTDALWEDVKEQYKIIQDYSLKTT